MRSYSDGICLSMGQACITCKCKLLFWGIFCSCASIRIAKLLDDKNGQKHLNVITVQKKPIKFELSGFFFILLQEL